jgi:hypothetical protein
MWDNRGMAWWGEARWGKVWLELAMARRDWGWLGDGLVRRCVVRYGEKRLGMVWEGWAWHDLLRCGVARLGGVMIGGAW